MKGRIVNGNCVELCRLILSYGKGTPACLREGMYKNELNLCD